jgi:ribosomal protein L44E
MLTILKKKTGYRLGLAFCIIGVVIVLVIVWKWWDIGVFKSANMLSAIGSSFFTVYPDLSLGIGIQPIHYTILAAALLIAGPTILMLRRERVGVTESVTVVLECQHCKNHWQETMSKSHLTSMGYPNARTLSRRRCPKCAKFTRPKITETHKS